MLEDYEGQDSSQAAGSDLAATAPEHVPSTVSRCRPSTDVLLMNATILEPTHVPYVDERYRPSIDHLLGAGTMLNPKHVPSDHPGYRPSIDHMVTAGTMLEPKHVPSAVVGRGPSIDARLTALLPEEPEAESVHLGIDNDSDQHYTRLEAFSGSARRSSTVRRSVTHRQSEQRADQGLRVHRVDDDPRLQSLSPPGSRVDVQPVGPSVSHV